MLIMATSPAQCPENQFFEKDEYGKDQCICPEHAVLDDKGECRKGKEL